MAIELRTFVPPKEFFPPVGRIIQLFDKISRIPRASGAEEGIRNYVLEYARHSALESHVDNVGNILVVVPATKGCEEKPGVILQTHMDMVTLPKDSPNDPAVVGVIPQVDTTGEWIFSEGTSLGADNGVGTAAAMTLAVDDSFQHGPIALLMTTDEEVGFTGANGLSFDYDFSNFKYLLNLDSERFGELCIGCAGGNFTEVVLPYDTELVRDRKILELNVSGLLGGHSGLDIDKGRNNAIKLLGNSLRMLLDENIDLRIISLKGGEKKNSIPNYATAMIALNDDQIVRAKNILRTLESFGRGRATVEEKKLKISLDDVDGLVSEVMMTEDSTQKTIYLINNLPNGVLKRFSDSDIIISSTNVGTLDLQGNRVNIGLLTRSSTEEDREKANSYIEGSVSASVIVSHELPFSGWEPNFDQEIIALLQEQYKDLTGKEIRLDVTHAGVECGAILQNPKFSHLQAVSFGPTIEGAHSVNERANIASIEKFYSLLKRVVEKIAA